MPEEPYVPGETLYVPNLGIFAIPPTSPILQGPQIPPPGGYVPSPTFGPTFTTADCPGCFPERIPTFGPSFSPFVLPGGFGPIYSPEQPTVPLSQDRFGGRMPLSDFTQARGSILGSIIRAGIGAAIPFLPGQGPPIVVGPYPGPEPGNPPDFPFPDVSTGISSMGCSSLRQRGRSLPQCYVTSPKGRRIRGKYVVLPNGQVTCCPSPRRMNPANSKALNRAARRLKGFVKLEKRIHKALARACGPIGRRAARSYSSARCGTCRKTKCVC